MNEWTKGMGEWMNGINDGWMSEWMNEWMDCYDIDSIVFKIQII